MSFPKCKWHHWHIYNNALLHLLCPKCFVFSWHFYTLLSNMCQPLHFIKITNISWKNWRISLCCIHGYSHVFIGQVKALVIPVPPAIILYSQVFKGQVKALVIPPLFNLVLCLLIFIIILCYILYFWYMLLLYSSYRQQL